MLKLNDFKIGDKVRMIKTVWNSKEGDTGIVKDFKGASLAVEFLPGSDVYEEKTGHNCDGDTEKGLGMYIEPHYVEKVAETLNEWIENCKNLQKM